MAGGDYEGALSFLHPDLVFQPPKEGLVFGREDLRQMWSQPAEEYEHLTSKLEFGPVEDLPDGRCLSTTRETLRWRESNEVAAVIERGVLWTLDDEKISEIRAFPNPEAARAAVSVHA